MHMKRLIFLRVTILVALLAIALSSVYVYYSILRHREITIDTWKSSSRTLADTLRHNILWDDRVTVRQMLLSELHESEALFYCFVIKGGEPYAYTFERGVPAPLTQQPHPTKQLVWEYQDHKGTVIYDIATPIDSAGTTLRLGLKRAVIDSKMKPLIISVGIITLAIIGIGLYMAHIISRLTTKEVDVFVSFPTVFIPISEYASMGVRILLKSWAIPPARFPRASIF